MTPGDDMEDNILCHQRGKDPFYKIWHASDEHLIMYFYSDGGSVVCAQKVFPIKKGSLVFIAANAYHYTMPEDPQRYDRSKLTISPHRLNQILDLLGEHNVFRDVSCKAILYAEIPPGEQTVVDAIWSEIALCGSEDERQLILLSCCMKLLFYLRRYSTGHTVLSPGIMGKAIDYINRNIASDICIEDICAAVGVSKHYFCRIFKQHTGMTVMQYILQTRIVLAKSELRKPELSITEISYRYGFSSVSYFCRVFKEETLCSPLQYRKRIFQR